jgi:hypothetical protein
MIEDGARLVVMMGCEVPMDDLAMLALVVRLVDVFRRQPGETQHGG